MQRHELLRIKHATAAIDPGVIVIITNLIEGIMTAADDSNFATFAQTLERLTIAAVKRAKDWPLVMLSRMESCSTITSLEAW